MAMKIFGLTGWSGSGKTTLAIRLIPELTGRGFSVSTMKHAHHGFDVDQPGKDSYRHRDAGATEVMVTSGKRWALMHEYRDVPEASPEELIRNMTPVDLLLIEGFKGYDHPKLEVWRSSVGKSPIHPDDPTIVAVASDGAVENTALPVLMLDDVPAIADFIVKHCKLNGGLKDS